MANGTDSDKFVLRSRGRVGHKRELAFALAQAEVSGSLGRTRARKAQNELPEIVNRKRLKKETKNEAQKEDDEKPAIGGQKLPSEGENVKVVEDLVESVSEDDAKSDVVDLMSDDEPKSHVAESMVTEKVSEDEMKNGAVEMAIDNEHNVGSIGNEDEPKQDKLKKLKKSEPEKPDLIETGEKVEGEVIEKPLKRYTRSGLKRKSQVAESILAQKVSEDEMKNGVVDMAIDNEPNTGCVGDSMSEVEPKQEELKISEPEQPLVKLEILDLIEKGDKVEREVIEKPQRRFTRSALKPNAENEALDFNSVLQKSPPVKLEMKMPKTTKFKLLELMETGILEGQPVTYLKGSKGRKAADKGLTGVITGSGIRCHCENCNGTDVVPPAVFELHAKSGNKRPPEYIYLENGKTLRDVITACNSSLETLEEAVRLAVGCSSVKTCAICLNCKGSICKDDSRLAMLLCGSCLELKEPQAKFSEAAKSTVAAKPLVAANDCFESPKLVSVTKCPDTDSKCPETVPERPETVPECPETVPECPETVPECPETVPERPETVPERPETVPERPETVPECPETIPECPETIPECPETVPECPETVPECPDTIPERPETIPECPDTVPECPDTVSKFPVTISNGPVSSSKFRETLLKSSSSASKSRGRVTIKDLGMHKLVFEDDILPDGTEVNYVSHGKKLAFGYKKGSGIMCSCCNKEVSPSQFEAHAGCSSRRKPYHNIFTSNGVSLHELSLILSKNRKSFTKDSDDLCSICKKGRNLICCNSCPRVFHAACLCLSTVPSGGTWYCKHCQTLFDREKDVEHNVNAVAAGRVAGVDPIKQITNRCIRIVTTFDEKFGGCALCRGHEFKNEGFGPGTVILCDQCEREFHVGCLKEKGIVDLKEVPKGKWFCHPDCLRIHSALQKLVAHGEQKLPESLLNVVRKKHNENGPANGALDIKWRVLSGKTSTDDESLQLLSKALAIFHDQFAPIVDSESRLDFIKEMLYGGAIKTQEFGGMYCAIVTLNESVVSAAMFRIYGAEVAELPLVATSADCQGQGYFQTLFSCIERFLAFLNVKILLLPAADEAASIWKNKFGFQNLNQSEIFEYRKRYPILIFHGTSVLQKSVPKCRIIGSQESKVKVESS